MNDNDKAELIQWLAAKGYGIQSISDGGPMPGAGLAQVNGVVQQTKVTTITVTKTTEFVPA